MASKPRQPALYELMATPRAERVPAPPSERPSPSEPPPSRFSAGRAIRVPAGYLWLGGGIGLGVLVGAFSLGYLRGQGDARREYEQEWLAVNQPRLPVPPPEISNAISPLPLERPLVERARREPPGEQRAPEGVRTATGWGPIGSDPRRAGLNYFVLIHTQRGNAERLAKFYREHGVEAYAMQAKNGSLYRVVALPGYARGERSSEAVGRLEQRIKDAQRKWKLRINPRDDLAYYPERFDG